MTESVVDFAESALLRLLYEDPMCRAWILPHDTPIDHDPFFEVPLDDLLHRQDRRGGDVDLLVVPHANPTASTGTQFKRVKVDAESFQTGLANKVHEIRKLARQANDLVELGFHQVFAAVLILVDARLVPASNRWLISTPPEIAQAVYNHIASAGFSEAVRIQTIEVCQPFDCDFRLRGSSGGRLVQKGRRQDQPDELTASIRSWMAGAG